MDLPLKAYHYYLKHGIVPITHVTSTWKGTKHQYNTTYFLDGTTIVHNKNLNKCPIG